VVNMREIAEEYRLSHWAAVMQERSARGVSIKAFCETEGIHPNRYFYWQRKLREAAHQAATAEGAGTSLIPQTPQGLVVSHSRNCSPMPPGWALCETSKPEPDQSAVQLEIGKSRVTVHAGTDKELLANVCRMLVSLC
jgi:putative transposase